MQKQIISKPDSGISNVSYNKVGKLEMLPD